MPNILKVMLDLNLLSEYIMIHTKLVMTKSSTEKVNNILKLENSMKVFLGNHNHQIKLE